MRKVYGGAGWGVKEGGVQVCGMEIRRKLEKGKWQLVAVTDEIVLGLKVEILRRPAAASG
jgi:hypothetical protein